MSDNAVLLAHEGPVLQIRLNRPEKKHALTHAMYEQLHDALRSADADANVRAIHLTGNGDAFTSGNDLKDFAQNPPDDLDAPVFHFLQALQTARKPVVAAVSGVAVGIGTTLLLHCDLVYCDETASFQLPFVNLGLCAEGGSSLLLPLLAGHQKAAELLLLGKPFDAPTAAAIGLVNDVLPAADLQAVSLQRARELAAQPAAAVRLTKALLKRSTQAHLAEVMREEGREFIGRLGSPEAKEAFAAFAEKRRPDFSRFD
ncbi:MAG: Enoyl-CoA hydratase/isomerase [Moraxellaceae bacterium]|nr:Enoyl-CoA hydratase/isomerase [Moraxellaceae bacterium]